MELRQLKTFVTVAELLSFNQAASVLNFAQSTVSSRIRGLEEELGVPLFDRLGKKIALTESGKTMLRYAKKMIDMEAETMAEVGQETDSVGTLSLRIPQSLGAYILPQALKQFQKAYPRFDMDINSCTFSSLKRELRSGITDMAFLLIDSIHEADLISEVLGFTDILFICANDSALCNQSNVQLSELENHTVLVPKYDCHYNKTFLQSLGESMIRPTSTIELNSIETIKSCVEAGVGLGILPEIAVREELKEGRFSCFQIEGEKVETAILMILHKDKWISSSMGRFIEEVRSCFSRPDMTKDEEVQGVL